ncbi:hypothetical protein H311_03189 [Anncaliia algerae PRA109]|nr:hypothetical protein H311_03189 [Anncaliia algerae PRA109]
MLTAYKMEKSLDIMNNREVIDFLFNEGCIRKEMLCSFCTNALKLVTFTRSPDNYAWRCLNKICIYYKKYISIRKFSFFDNIKIKLKDIMLILLKYSCKNQRFQILLGLDHCSKTIHKIKKKLVERIPVTDFHDNKLGGPHSIVQIDETMLNYKCKSHRGRSPSNKPEYLCIVEVSNNITRDFATLISDKKNQQ